MKLSDFLGVFDSNVFVTIQISAYSATFESRHTAEYFLNSGQELKNKMVKKAYTSDGDIYIKLED